MSLLDIFLAANRAMDFVAGQDKAAFESDARTRWAVYSQIVIIGEACRRISREFQMENPQIPWSEIIGMRHRLIHDYDDFDWDFVWDTVANDLPRLNSLIEPLIPKEE